MIQSTYKDNLDEAYAGQIDTLYPYSIMSRSANPNPAEVNGFGKEYLIPGKVMVPGIDNYAEGTDIVNGSDDPAPEYWLGVGTLTHTGESHESGETRFTEGKEMGILEEGVIWMYCETAINFGEPLGVISEATVVAEVNNSKVGNVARRSASIANVTIIDTPTHLRSLGVLTEAGLVRVRVYPHLPAVVVP